MAAENPHAPPEAPPQRTCPICEQADQVEDSRHLRAPLYCGRCELLFEGTFAEWHAMLARRDAHRAGKPLAVAGNAGVQADWDPAR